MGKGLGIAALILILLGMFIPFIGIFITWLALALATVAALSGDRTFSIATGVIGIVGVIFFSPLLWVAGAGESMQGKSFIQIVTIVTLLGPFIGVALNATGKVVLGKSKTTA